MVELDLFKQKKLSIIHGLPPSKIVEVLEEGYMYKDRLLKASKVVVSS